MAAQDKQGTGKHGRKDTEEPWPHHEGKQEQHGRGGAQHAARRGSDDEGRSSESGHSGGERRSRGGGSENKPLKEREYRDEQGDIHHRTKPYMEQHGKDKER